MTRNEFIQQATLALMGNPAFLENSCRVDVGGIDYSAAEFAAKMARKLEHKGVAFDIDTTHSRPQILLSRKYPNTRWLHTVKGRIFHSLNTF